MVPEMEHSTHILFISSWYPSRQDPTLGIFNRFFADAASLYNKVSVLHIASSDTLENEFEYTESIDNNILTVTVYYKKVKPGLPLITQLMKRNRVLKAFDRGYERLVQKAGRPDLIQLNVIMPMGVGAYHLSARHGIPYVVNENWSGYGEEDGSYRGLVQKFYTRRIVRHAKAILPTSTYLRDAMLSHGLTGNYTVIPNVVDVKLFRPLPSEPHSQTKLIHISSLNDREKNVSGLIRAFRIAVSRNPQLELNIVGEGVDREKYQALVKNSGLSGKVHFKGRLFKTELVKEINANDALIMFSNFETFCLVIIEAFACAKPVITSNAGAIKTYMKPELGIMVERQNEAQLADAIVDFASGAKTYNPDYIREFAVQNYSYEKVGEKLTEIYKLALKKS